MILNTYYNLSEPNVVNKNLSGETVVNGLLREQSSLLNPSFTLELSYVPNFNYVYIPDFSRYYFITNITSLRTNLWEIECKVDVLMSFKDSILRQSAIIARQENLYNLYLDDDKFLVNANRLFQSIEFPNKLASASSGRSFVLTIAGGAYDFIPEPEPET